MCTCTETLAMKEFSFDLWLTAETWETSQTTDEV